MATGPTFVRHGRLLIAMAMVMMATHCALATPVYFEPQTPIAIPPTVETGYYLNVTNGEFGPVGEVANPSIGWYTTTSGTIPFLHFGVPTGSGSGYQGARLNSPLNLEPGTCIGPESSFYNGTGLGTAFQQEGTEIAGFRFIDLETSEYNYGWIRVTTTSGGGYPAAILDWAYDDSGAPVYAGIVPEPATLATLAFAGLCFLPRRRRR